MSNPLDDLPFTPPERKIINHATLCATGFLVLVPFGILIPRYLRTFTNKWIYVHLTINFLIAAPIIFVGWSFGYQTTNNYTHTPPFSDPHQKSGLALLILYCIQLSYGLFIHFMKFDRFKGRRAPWNYFHPIIGIAIVALACFQVHYGFTFKWPQITGRDTPKGVKVAWTVWIVVFWVVWLAGVFLLGPRQVKQEKAARRELENSNFSEMKEEGSR